MRARSLLAVVVLCAAAPAMAQQATCTGSNVSISLGTYEAYQSGHLDSSASVVVNCTRDGGPANISVMIALGPSLNSGSIATRQLRTGGGPDVLEYNFYRDAGRSQVWGNNPGVNTVSITQFIPNKSTLAFTFTIFGRINALQDVRAGAYNDSLVMTVDF